MAQYSINDTNEKLTRQTEGALVSTQVPETLRSDIYLPGYLRENIGKIVRVEFLIGTNQLNDRVGILKEVGASYIVLGSLQGFTETVCDIYSIKFVTISNDSYNIANILPCN